MVRNINQGNLDEGITPLHGGSREVTQVYNSFASLFRIVRVSKTSFYSGDIEWASHVVYDAINLFRKLGDEKATGIACNNMGNILFSLSSTGKISSTVQSIKFKVEDAAEYYDEAIRIGCKELENASSDCLRTKFAEQLADRCMNRAMYCLERANSGNYIAEDKEGDSSDIVSHEADRQDFFRQLAYDDIAKAQELDVTARNYWLQNKLLLANSEQYFDRMIRRLYAAAATLKLDKTCGVLKVFDMDGLMEEANQFLTASWDEEQAPLFEKIGRIGRLQQLEGAVISLLTSYGNDNEVRAAQYAIRMLVEDEYLIDSAFVASANAMLHYLSYRRAEAEDGEEPENVWSEMAESETRVDINDMLRKCKTSLDQPKSVVFAMELRMSQEANSANHETTFSKHSGSGWSLVPEPTVNAADYLRTFCASLYELVCHEEDLVGVAVPSQHRYSVDLTRKFENGEIQVQEIHKALKTLGDHQSDSSWTAEESCGSSTSSALFWSLQTLSKQDFPTGSDCFIFVIDDGGSPFPSTDPSSTVNRNVGESIHSNGSRNHNYTPTDLELMIAQINAEHNWCLHLVVFGFELPDDDERVEYYCKLTSSTDLSTYVRLDRRWGYESALDHVLSLLASRNRPVRDQNLQRGLTMQRF
jgi:hypothetical protein